MSERRSLTCTVEVVGDKSQIARMAHHKRVQS